MGPAISKWSDGSTNWFVRNMPLVCARGTQHKQVGHTVDTFSKMVFCISVASRWFFSLHLKACCYGVDSSRKCIFLRSCHRKMKQHLPQKVVRKEIQREGEQPPPPNPPLRQSLLLPQGTVHTPHALWPASWPCAVRTQIAERCMAPPRSCMAKGCASCAWHLAPRKR